jgi:hypothetical protein
MTMRMRAIGTLLAATLVAFVAGCGSDGGASKAPVGSPQNPAVAIKPAEKSTSETGAVPKLGYATLLKRQKTAPKQGKTNNPCTLVTKAQAQKILGGKLLDPVSVPQGPTCVYRSHANRLYATISIQAQSFTALRKQLHRAQRVDIAQHHAYCGTYGRPVLYLPLSGGRVLSVAAQCDTAVRLARRAGARLLR